MRFLLSASLLALSAPLCLAQTLIGPDDPAPAKPPTSAVSFDVHAIDKTANPCADFYQYACGTWNRSNPIPADRVRWGRFDELQEHNQYLLYTELKSAADAPKTPLQKKYGDYFAACMNVADVNKLGTRPLQPDLDAISALPDIKALAAYNAKAEARGGSGFFGIGVTQDQKDSTQQIAVTSQGGLTLPDRDYYLSEEPRYKTIRDQYVAHVTRMFVLLGDPQDKAAQEAADVMRIETALARGSMARVEMRDPAKRYHIMTVAELQQLSPNYDWPAYLVAIHMQQVKTIDVTSPGFVTAVNTELGTEPLGAIKSYLRWHAVHTAAPLLSKPFEEENFAFFNATLNGQKEEEPRWKRCTSMTDRALGEAVGQDWVKQYFPPTAKANTEQLIKALETAMAEDLKTLDWMSPQTKVEAKAKLDAIVDKIGYPEHWRDYSKLMIKRDDLLGNARRSQEFEHQRNLGKYGKPVDKTEWGMTPPTVNAYYDPSQNNINFPAGILQPPFYDNSADAAVNFGAIGVVIGHEMTHGFDDEGSKYDLNGNVRQWWTDEDRKKFDERTECTAKEYDGFEVAPGQNLNGHLTLGENTADNGGLRIAYQALLDTITKEGAAAEPGYSEGKRDGYTPAQRYFISFAQVWCGNTTEQAARVRAKTDPHSSGQWRVDGAVQNFDEFGKAFGCKVGDPMMPTSGGCRTW